MSGRRWGELVPAVQAALWCNRRAAWVFLDEKYKRRIWSGTDAAQAVREICGVESRRELRHGTPEAERWFALYAEFQAWMEIS